MNLFIIFCSKGESDIFGVYFNGGSDACEVEKDGRLKIDVITLANEEIGG